MSTFSKPSGTVSSSVLVADGYGVQLRVHRGRLVIEDGMGSSRRVRELSRIERNIRRLVVLADTGTVSLDAVRWCADVGIAVVQLDRDGRLLLLAGTPGTDDARLRRAQAAAPSSPVGLDIARALLTAKLLGQAQLCRTELGNEQGADNIDRAAHGLGDADLVGCRDLEARASNNYWGSWAASVQCRFAVQERGHVPDRWASFGARRSPIQRSATPRAAATPINALLNYGYALAEVECRLALLTLGLDPGMGIVHTDLKNRDSLALDLLEPLRPIVDGHVLKLLASRHFRAADFHETRDGVCRLLEPLTHELTGWLPTYRMAAAPIAESIAHALATSSPGKIELRTPLSRANHAKVQQRGQRSASRRDPTTPLPMPTCRDCGIQLQDRRRQLCPTCWPVSRDAQARRMYAESQQARFAGETPGPDPSQSAAARAKRSHTLAATKAAEAAWARAGGISPVSQADLGGVLARLHTVTIRELVEVTGLSVSACSRIRSGKLTPHPRHWASLAAVASPEASNQARPATDQ